MKTLIDKYNQEIDFLCSLHKIPKDVRKHLANHNKNSWGNCDVQLHSKIQSVKDWLDDFSKKASGKTPSNSIDSLDRIKNLCLYVKGIRADYQKEVAEVSVYEKAMNESKSRFDNLFARFFPRASSELKAEVCTDKQGFACSLTATRESSYYNNHKITIPITWHKKIADNNLHYIPSGRRTYFTINLVKEDNKYLKEKNISCFRGTLLDPAYKKRDKEYGYAFSPELLTDQVVLIKQDIAGNYTFGVGHNVHKAESLLSRRTNAKVMKSILGE
mgnify:CR=1 FL=1